MPYPCELRLSPEIEIRPVVKVATAIYVDKDINRDERKIVSEPYRESRIAKHLLDIQDLKKIIWRNYG